MSSYINMIDSPRDLKKLHPDQLKELAEEIREKIIRTVAKSGGHLSSSLGAVELTVALHYVLDAPHDKIVWDVGHQSYAHKIITGRRESFRTLRTEGGVSGFPRPVESIYDTFATGHSSTSISAASGLAAARDLRGGKERIVSIIGDGALTGGMAFEALNFVGSNLRKFMVILNDNEMSISRNVGAMSAYLNRIITAPLYNKFVEEVDGIVKKIPGIGDKMVHHRHKLAESIKGLVVPGLLFEELGFRYIGPVDGNNMLDLVHILSHIKDIDQPILLHAVTRKGKGYSHAEENPEKFHSAAKFNISTGEFQNKSTTTSFTEVFSNGLVEIAEEDDKVIAITAAMTHGAGLFKFKEKFPERFFDAGIAEQHAVTFAGGLAISGYKPVVAIYSTFMQRAYDQILHDICLQKLPVVFALDRAGLVGPDGPTHHGVFDISYLNMMPNMTIICPKDGEELKAMLRFAIKHDGPVAIRYPKAATTLSPDGDFQEDLIDGTGKIERYGDDVAIFAVGCMVETALEAADILEKQGLQATVINPRFIKPLDSKLIARVAENIDTFFTVEEHAIKGGFGHIMAAELSKNNLNHVQLVSLGIPDKFIEHATREAQLKKCSLTPETLAKKIAASIPEAAPLPQLK
jgi:1-deoxy-D-xylulose-5-phosphate synthase